MKKVNFNYSLKNIPIPSNSSYKLMLIDKMELLVKRMRWKAHFFLEEQKRKENKKQDTTHTPSLEKETYGFKTNSCPPPVKELEAFEKDLFDIVKTLKFRKISNEFQSQLNKDIKMINQSKNVFVPADKTSNLYELNPEN